MCRVTVLPNIAFTEREHFVLYNWIAVPVLLEMLRHRTWPTFAMTASGAVTLGALAFATARWQAVPAVGDAGAAFAISLPIGIYTTSFWRSVRRYANMAVAPVHVLRTLERNSQVR